MIEEEIAELNRIKEWAVILKIYYGILNAPSLNSKYLRLLFPLIP